MATIYDNPPFGRWNPIDYSMIPEGDYQPTGTAYLDPTTQQWNARIPEVEIQGDPETLRKAAQRQAFRDAYANSILGNMYIPHTQLYQKPPFNSGFVEGVEEAIQTGAGAGGRFAPYTQPEYTDEWEVVPVQRSFNEAFEEARDLMKKGGPNVFEFNGKLYSTDLGNDPRSQEVGAQRKEDIGAILKRIKRRKENANSFAEGGSMYDYMPEDDYMQDPAGEVLNSIPQNAEVPVEVPADFNQPQQVSLPDPSNVEETTEHTTPNDRIMATETKDIQQELINRGYLNSKINPKSGKFKEANGIWGAKTANAYKKYLEDQYKIENKTDKLNRQDRKIIEGQSAQMNKDKKYNPYKS